MKDKQLRERVVCEMLKTKPKKDDEMSFKIYVVLEMEQWLAEAEKGVGKKGWRNNDQQVQGCGSVGGITSIVLLHNRGTVVHNNQLYLARYLVDIPQKK